METNDLGFVYERPVERCIIGLLGNIYIICKEGFLIFFFVKTNEPSQTAITCPKSVEKYIRRIAKRTLFYCYFTDFRQVFGSNCRLG